MIEWLIIRVPGLTEPEVDHVGPVYYETSSL